MEVNQNELVQIRVDKLKKLQSEGKDPFLNESFDFTHYSTDIVDKFDELEGKEVALAGRIVLFREHGKASFATIQDYKGRAQIYVRQDKIGDEAYEDFSAYDMGDIIGVHGTVFKTQKGEISVRADKVVFDFPQYAVFHVEGCFKGIRIAYCLDLYGLAYGVVVDI